MDADAISVGFDATFDELVDASLRAIGRSKIVRRWRRQSAIVLGVTVGFSVVIFWWTVLAPAWLIVWAIAAGGAAAAVYVPWLRHCYIRRVRRIVAEEYGGEKAVRCDISVDGAGLHVSQGLTQTTYAWDNAALRNENEGDIEIWFGRHLVVVRDRAFHSLEERARFVSRVRELARR